MMPSPVAVTFDNRRGARLFGILHRPPGDARRDLAVVLLSPGVKMRVGPQRLYLELTDALLELGLTVFRFDFHGLGDSEGKLPESELRDVYNQIEVGRYVDDTIDALDWMEKTHGFRRCIVSGLCGGAITGLLAAERDLRVAGLLAIGITPVLAANTADISRYMTTGQLESAQRMYLRRLSNPTAWIRLLTFQADYRLIGRMVRHWLKKVRTCSARQAPLRAASATPDNANPLFPPAFFKMLATRRPMLLVFGGADRLHYEYEEKFVARHREKLVDAAELVDVQVVAQANHVLSLREWQRPLLDHTARWVSTHFGTFR